MEGHIERESGALGGLFQHIIQDMKVRVLGFKWENSWEIYG